ncbi:MAG: FKBP-type peptidyl-prolyl cis-trans isomerase [Magnetococcales bacterium]|nr:FKBP-type peptidyl-prolyl cis-trans isomerase [Magnetococcales bacterium]
MSNQDAGRIERCNPLFFPFYSAWFGLVECRCVADWNAALDRPFAGVPCIVKKRLGKIWARLVNLALGPKREAYHRRAGNKFRQENGQRPEVTTTRSGLQWEVLRAAEGPKPGFSSRVLVHYRGTLVNGIEFDSSYARQQPIAFGLLEVISGWREGLQLMSVGSQYRFVIPPDIAYGSGGAGLLIAPSSTLIFDVELLEVISDR